MIYNDYNYDDDSDVNDGRTSTTTAYRSDHQVKHVLPYHKEAITPSIVRYKQSYQSDNPIFCGYRVTIM